MGTFIELLSNDVLLASLVGLALLTLILIVLVVRLQTKLRKLVSGKDGKSLECDIVGIQKNLESTSVEQKEIREYLRNIEKRLRRSIQGVGTIRFNPFKGTGSGGNQSFATALLSEDGDGAVISSLYSRERVSIFSKPIKKFKSEYELSTEEKHALQKAKEQSH
ncbi:MAG TPA: DUF4446 family protein [Candidatus Yonathbacteria bacterium]|nr:DUF4446 family protein [Candidatus Yonathbacteria bacterium]